MRKNLYSDYASRSLTWYIRNPDKREHLDGCTKAERLNWECCDRVFRALPKHEQGILIDIYRQPFEDFKAAVDAAAQVRGISPNTVWRLIDRVMQTFAKDRGLI